MPTIQKQPWEKFYVGVDFSPLLSLGEEIDFDRCEVVAYDMDTGEDVTEILIDPGTFTLDGSALLVRVRGGEPAKVYKVSLRATTTNDNRFEEDIYVLTYD